MFLPPDVSEIILEDGKGVPAQTLEQECDDHDSSATDFHRLVELERLRQAVENLTRDREGLLNLNLREGLFKIKFKFISKK